ncbi:hypothetical protein HYW53_00070 [Candidatus Giovannonibacteria bacterium]|nr:hypothetical protein [Candidatus Giovannonibacteria bacterium]
MSKIEIYIFIFALIVAGFFILKSAPLSKENISNDQSSEKIELETKTDEQKDVTVTVTPVDISEKSEKWKFNISMSTHIVELSQDMVLNSMLMDDRGKEYAAIQWEGAPPGGHHREGALIYNAIKPVPKSIELRIADVGGVIRTFKWSINVSKEYE